MTAPPAPACPNGASPNAAGTSAQHVWVDLTTYAQGLVAEWKRIMPWINGAIPSRFVSVIDLCNMNPSPPAPLTLNDFRTTALDVWAGPILPPAVMNKVWQQLYYDAFVNLCQCNASVGECVEHDIAASTATNMTYSPNAEGYCWPTSTTGISNSPIFVPYGLPFNCPVVDIFVDTNPHIPNLVLNPLHIYDCAGVDHGSETQAGSTTRVTLSNCANNPTMTSVQLIICTFDGGGRPNWTIRITPVGGGSGGTAPPPQTPNQTTGVATPPNLVCDPAGACTIQWGIIQQIQNNVSIGGQTIDLVQGIQPSSYVEGNSYTVTGQGVQGVAQDTLGAVVQLLTLPAGSQPTATDPPRYYDIGYIQFGAADAIDGKKWLHSSGDRFIPAFPEIDRIYYNLSQGVTVTLVELVPPPTGPPS